MAAGSLVPCEPGECRTQAADGGFASTTTVDPSDVDGIQGNAYGVDHEPVHRPGPGSMLTALVDR